MSRCATRSAMASSCMDPGSDAAGSDPRASTATSAAAKGISPAPKPSTPRQPASADGVNADLPCTATRTNVDDGVGSPCATTMSAAPAPAPGARNAAPGPGWSASAALETAKLVMIACIGSPGCVPDPTQAPCQPSCRPVPGRAAGIASMNRLIQRQRFDTCQYSDASTVPCRRNRPVDPAAAEHAGTVVQYGSLSGRNAVLRRSET